MNNTSKVYCDYVVFVQSKSLRGRSKAEYLRQVRKLAERHPKRSLKQLTERMVFDHLIYLRDEQKLRPSTLNQAVVALRLFYRDYLGRNWPLWEAFEIRRDQPLPVVLSRTEVRALLNATRENRFKAVLSLIYHCGLRVGEAVRLRPCDIDSARGVVRVIDGKGGRNREVPIAPQMIERLRGYWSFHRNRAWLFPGVGRAWRERCKTLQVAMASADSAMSVSSVQAALRIVVAAAQIKKAATCHSLRHSFATHLLESGVSIRQVSEYLGHASVTSTLIYLHVTEISEGKGREAQAALIEQALGAGSTGMAT
jgi:integrase/recombinase XerD